MAAKKAKKTGVRYTAEQKAEILNFIEQQGRGGATQAAKKFKVSPLTLTSWKKKAAGGNAAPATTSGGIKPDAVLKVLAGKGFKIVRMQNVLTGEIMEDKIDPKIQALKLELGGLKGRADDSTTYVVSTERQILVTMTLDRLLAITGTKPQ